MKPINNKLNIFVIGTRAQLIKVAPIIKESEKQKKTCLMLMTGQHKDTMSDIILEFDLKTKQVFAVESKERSTIFSLIYWFPRAIISVFLILKNKKLLHPEISVLVHGDTLTTLISACCAKSLGLVVVHLESGLTSKKIFSPFPEELIRRIVFKLTDVAYCPDRVSTEHMKKISSATVINTEGNTIFDAVDIITKNNEEIKANGKYIVFSIHRFQNIYNKKRLAYIVDLIISLSEGIEIKFILHPATKKKLQSFNLIKALQGKNNITLKDRMPYGDFIRLLSGSSCVFTDGGSNQEELSYLGIPTIIMRDATERIDGLGKNAVMEADIEDIPNYIKSNTYIKLKKIPSLKNESRCSKIIVQDM